MNLTSILICGIVIMLFISCEKENTGIMKNEDEIEVELGYIRTVIIPSVGKVNETINISIYTGIVNDCYGVGKFIETIVGDTITVGVELWTARRCVSFGPVLPMVEYYPFKASSPGVYYLKFISSPTTVITDSLIITD